MSHSSLLRSQAVLQQRLVVNLCRLRAVVDHLLWDMTFSMFCLSSCDTALSLAQYVAIVQARKMDWQIKRS